MSKKKVNDTNPYNAISYVKKNKRYGHSVNIYLTREDKRKLNEIKYRYHLSYSTIANILVNHLCMPCKLDLIYKYIYEETEKIKTHIEPRNNKDHQFGRYVYTNAIKIYLKQDLKKYINDDRKIQSINGKIQREFETTIEDNWDGNRFNRNMVRWLKRNKDYAQEILDGTK